MSLNVTVFGERNILLDFHTTHSFTHTHKHAPPEENDVHFKVKCINLVQFESLMKRLDL